MLNKNMAKQVFMIITLTISTMLSGCGVAAGSSKKESIPKLVEPAALNEAYRPVSYSSVGTTEALLATAAPREYCHYYNANVKLMCLRYAMWMKQKAGLMRRRMNCHMKMSHMKFKVRFQIRR